MAARLDSPTAAVICNRTAEKFFLRAVDLNEEFYGEGSDKVANSLRMAASVYIVQKDYAKAETYLVRALNIDESIFGHDGINILMPLFNVCTLYDKWGKPTSWNPAIANCLECSKNSTAQTARSSFPP